MAVYSPVLQYACTTHVTISPLPPVEQAIHRCLCSGPAGPDKLAATFSLPLSAINRAIVKLLRHGLITLASDSTVSHPPRAQYDAYRSLASSMIIPTTQTCQQAKGSAA